MRTARILVLLLAGSVLAIGGRYAEGQAEVSPDHYEPTVHVATASQPATPVHLSRHHNLHMTASRRAGRQRHHHSHAFA
jgi:hypothetical protein